MHELPANSTVERRRSRRISESVPLVIRGTDLLGHPFEEHTTTLTLNLQGCRYFSRHNLPRNSWVDIEVAEGEDQRTVRARVAWIHRPHAIGDLFQVAVELDGSANIWGLKEAPIDWDSSHWSQKTPAAESASASGVIPSAVASPEIVMGDRPLPLTTLSDSPAESGQASMGNSMSQAPVSFENTAAIWRERLQSEMDIAQHEWDELLQSSIDRSLQRLSEQLPERAQEAARATEEKIARQFASLSETLVQISSEAQDALAGVKSAIDQEVSRARESIEQIRRQLLDRIGTEAEARVAPHAARVPELVRELAARDEQMAESLHLHRERLRHASDYTLRDIAAHSEAVTASVRLDFERARSEALTKWHEELETLDARSSHAAAEALGRTSEWLQQDTRERLQLLSEQTLASATAKLEEQANKAAGLFETHLEGQSIFHLAHVHQQLDGVADDLAVQTRTKLAEAAEAAAASFGEVLHNISSERTERFDQASRSALDTKRQELEDYTRQARAAFENESSASLDAHRSEFAARAEEWSQNLNRIADEAAAENTGRIRSAADAWTLTSVRRLNEHGQNIIDSLIRSADQALRDSASKMFEGLAAALRDQAADSSGPPAGANFAEASSPENPHAENGSNQMARPATDNAAFHQNA